MLFNSQIFLLVFLPLVLAGYHFLGSGLGRRASVVWLVGMSLVFYGWWNPVYLWLLGASVVVNFLLGRRQARTVEARGRGSRLQLALGVAFNLGLLGFFKYTGFLAASVNWYCELLGWGAAPLQVSAVVPPAFLGAAGEIVLPLGISFFTFQQIAFLADSHAGQAREYDFFDYALFVTFFPQLIAGPIVHHAEVLPQFARNPACLRADQLGVGLTMLIMGLVKKVLLADGLMLCARGVFAAAETDTPSLLAAWGGLITYAGQLYFDFSAYSDMAIGIARCLGITLPMNFDSPLKATSIIDFWQRWHITLSRFLRDYLFFPLCGRGRPGLPRFLLAVFVTFLLCGVWHGSGPTYIVWGACHGAMMVVNHLWRRLARARRWAEPGPRLVTGYRLLTFLCFVLSLAFFRCETLLGAGRLLAGLFGAGGCSLPGSWAVVPRWLGFEPTGPAGEIYAGLRFAGMGAFPTKGIGWGVATLVIVWLLPNTHQIMHRVDPVLAPVEPPAGWRRIFVWRPTWYHSLIVAVLFLVCLVNLTDVSEFIYWQF